MVEHTCACGTATRARAPEGVSAPVQFGANVRAMICFLYLGQFLSAARTAQALSELVGRVVSAGTVVSTAGRAAAGLEAFTAKAAQQIAAAEQRRREDEREDKRRRATEDERQRDRQAQLLQTITTTSAQTQQEAIRSNAQVQQSKTDAVSGIVQSSINRGVWVFNRRTGRWEFRRAW